MSAARWLAEVMGDKVDGESISEAVKEKRRLRDKEGEITAREAAEKTLSESKRTKQWMLRPNETELFYTVMTDPENRIASSTDMERIFPGMMRGNRN